MTNVSPFQSIQSRRTEQASVWVAKLDTGKVTAHEKSALREWLSASPHNYQEFMETARLLDRMDSLSLLADIFPEPDWQPSQVKKKPAIWQHTRAAVVLLLVTGFIISLAAFNRLSLMSQIGLAGKTTPHRYETAIGEQSVFELSDGTRMVLNTNSVVIVNYSDKSRTLKLVQGEINVNVAHDPSRPLSVMVGDKVVRAVGTEFNVEITQDKDIELMVAEGVVMIGVLDAPVNTSDSTVKNKSVLLRPSSKLITAGQEAYIDAGQLRLDGLQTNNIEAEEIAVKLSWREGNLIFRGESLEEAVSEVERYTAVEFVFLDEKSKKVRLAGLFRTGDVDGLLTALRQNFNISHERVSRDKILLSSR